MNTPSNQSEQQPVTNSKLRRTLVRTVLGVAAGALVVTAASDNGDSGKHEDSQGAVENCFAKATDHPENLKVKDCTPDRLDAEVVGPTTIQIKDKIITVMSGKGKINYMMPNQIEMSDGVEYSIFENPIDSVQISSKGNMFLGIEGNGFNISYPDSLNPHKSEGDHNIQAIKAEEGSMLLYDVSGAPIQVVPSGATVYREVRTGKVGSTPEELK